MAFYVYMLASRRNGTLYVGSTDNLTVRISQHKQELKPGFTSRYGVKDLVWYEVHDTRDGAFRRELRIKDWKRAWKVRLIETRNLAWRDLSEDVLRGPIPGPSFPAGPSGSSPPKSARPGGREAEARSGQCGDDRLGQGGRS